MKRLYSLPFVVVLLIAVTACLSSCKNTILPTRVAVLDSVRHYYSTLQGQDIDIYVYVGNVGEEPLVLTEIQPSCGCISVEKGNNNIVAPHGQTKLHFKFQTDKYTGYVRHTIRLFGNILPRGVAYVIFDTNVVPPYHASPDYEESYHQYVKETHRFEQSLEADESERGYWINKGDYPEDYSKHYQRYPWRIKSKVNVNY